MPGRDIVVIGASAGGLQGLTTLVRLLPADLPAAVCDLRGPPSPYNETKAGDSEARASTIRQLLLRSETPSETDRGAASG